MCRFTRTFCSCRWKWRTAASIAVRRIPARAYAAEPLAKDEKPPPPPAQKDRFRGVRIFDITDIKNPKQVAAVQTCRGSHTHTLVVDPNDKDNVYIYVSGTSFVRQAEELAGCSGQAPDKDPNTALFRIDVIKVPLAAPQDAKIVSTPRLFRMRKRQAECVEQRWHPRQGWTGKPRIAISVTTSPFTLRWDSLPARVPETESCSTSKTR